MEECSLWVTDDSRGKKEVKFQRLIIFDQIHLTKYVDHQNIWAPWPKLVTTTPLEIVNTLPPKILMYPQTKFFFNHALLIAIMTHKGQGMDTWQFFWQQWNFCLLQSWGGGNLAPQGRTFDPRLVRKHAINHWICINEIFYMIWS